MTEPLAEPPAPRTSYEPTAPEGELARQNVRFGLMLFGLFVLLFAGTIVVALIYLQVD